MLAKIRLCHPLAQEIRVTRVLAYSHDTFGLGKIRRMLRVLEAFVDHDTDHDTDAVYSGHLMV
jgi:predicted glycosyltransferase